MSEADIALPAGYTLNEYRIESTLGVGGFGLTYLATDLNLNLKVAIKEYLPGDLAYRCADQTILPKSDESLDTFQWALARFLDESRTLASFRHANIVRVMRYFKANSTAYMVMEFVQGEPFHTWVKDRRPLSQKEILSIVMPLLDGLELVHRAGFLHRDIKPNNIFIREDGSPVLLDFGSARQTSANHEMTAIVTPGYAPFEQSHTHGNQGPWSDIYALGAVLYWTITGQPPVEAAARVRKDIMPAASQISDRSRYNPALLKAIDWALTPFEEERPQSVAEFRQALQNAEKATALAPIATTVAYSNSRAAPSHEAPPASTNPSNAASFDSEVLKQIVAELAPHIGPIAPVVVKSAAKKSETISQLIERVAAEIPDDKAREAFVKKYTAALKTAPKTVPKTVPVANVTLAARTRVEQSQPTSAPVQFDAITLARAESELARNIGAIAKVVVSRSAKKARDITELYMLLGDNIDDKEERKAFVRKAIAARDDFNQREEAARQKAMQPEITQPSEPIYQATVRLESKQDMTNPSGQGAVMFADVSGSTKLYETKGDAIAESTINQYINLLKLKTDQHRGRVIKTIGDEIMALFPTADAAANAAVEMQNGVAAFIPSTGVRIGIRIGFNYGPIVERQGDVFGDAVNLASRLASQAQKDQIITCQETVDALSPALRFACRKLYSIQVKGKEHEVELCQVLWQQSEDTTKLVRSPVSVQPKRTALKLRYRNQDIVLDATHDSLLLGRDQSAELVVHDPKASRAHCKIERRMDKFVLADHSANGTFISVDGDRREVVLRREEFTLRNRGWITLGQSRADTTEVVEFICEE